MIARYWKGGISSAIANLMGTCKAEKYPVIRKTDRSIDSRVEMTVNVAV